ncbi:enoyl-CoA hydratase/isomerase family protein [Klenkia sp. PcliD-1-E]|uniref:enoyl-CoA hydratase/isomerase family protein n=1 Tax=Klenkia sp. PcliD-1-E TaxID=2954492 RepID=UPI002096F05A|nr:enoyl-CoA hydratase-related protein [Klenkia sp. PcliD-1-E]MCO7218564.1 enoyl-CoA hydratase-related protein [Klenkia sp. PcliD-1-E]
MTVTYEVVRRVAWLTIDRPEARNALSAEVRRLLTEGFERFAADPDAAVLVLTGAGEKAFCAGGDLREMADTGLTVPPPDFVPQPGRTVQIDKPVIAAVNGIAYGGGFLLAQQCDLVIAAEHARFAVSEAKLGRGAPWAAPLSWLVPPRVAMQLLVTGDPITAERAREVGLVNEVVPADQLHEAAQALGERIAANAPLSVAAAKQTVRLMAGHRFAEAYAEAEALWEPVYLSADAQEGPAAFRDKRTPVWQGR